VSIRVEKTNLRKQDLLPSLIPMNVPCGLQTMAKSCNDNGSHATISKDIRRETTCGGNAEPVPRSEVVLVDVVFCEHERIPQDHLIAFHPDAPQLAGIDR
jgi:hypothetical protein